MTTLQEVVGEQIWERFFVGHEVVLEQYVPFQLGNILNAALARAETALKKYGRDWDFAERAKDRFIELKQEDDTATGKRSRPYSPY